MWKFACRAGDLHDGGPSAMDVLAQCPQAHESSADVEKHLYNVCPDDCGHASLKRVEQRERGDDGYGEDVSRADGDANDDGDGKDSDALRGCAQQQKKQGRDLVQAGAEALVNELVGGEEFALKILWQKEQSHNDTAREKANHELPEPEVARVGDAGDADDGE